MRFKCLFNFPNMRHNWKRFVLNKKKIVKWLSFCEWCCDTGSSLAACYHQIKHDKREAEASDRNKPFPTSRLGLARWWLFKKTQGAKGPHCRPQCVAGVWQGPLDSVLSSFYGCLSAWKYSKRDFREAWMGKQWESSWKRICIVQGDGYLQNYSSLSQAVGPRGAVVILEWQGLVCRVILAHTSLKSCPKRLLSLDFEEWRSVPLILPSAPTTLLFFFLHHLLFTLPPSTPLCPWPLPCSPLRSRTMVYSERNAGKKRNPVSQNCLFADGISKSSTS